MKAHCHCTCFACHSASLTIIELFVQAWSDAIHEQNIMDSSDCIMLAGKVHMIQEGENLENDNKPVCSSDGSGIVVEMAITIAGKWQSLSAA